MSLTFKKAFSPAGLSFGILNNMGQLASVGLAGDMMATLGALPQDWMAAPGKQGFRALSPSAVPILGMGSDLMNVGKDGVGLFKGEFDPSQTLKDLQKVVPFAKAAGIHQALNAISGSLE